jgi:hypothetical protein
MVNKSKIIILSIFIFSLAFFLLNLISKNSLACHLSGPSDYYQTCNAGATCSYDDQCLSGKVSAYDFVADFGGCVMAYAAGQYYSSAGCSGAICICYTPEAKWDTSPSYNGQICKKKWGLTCGRVDGGEEEGKWDSSDSKCVVCDSYRRETGYFDCNGDYSGDYKCESACGADPACDEKLPNGMYDTDGDGYFDLYCDSNCYAYKCNASTECSSILWYKCSYNYYYSTSSPRYDWLSSPHEGYPWQSCFDNHDNDCDGYKDCADSDCRGVRNQNTGVICCQSDSDCSGYDPTTHTKYVCECQDSSKCSITGSSYTCKPKPSCRLPEDCDNGWCCDYSVGGLGSCKQKGMITSYGGRSYICDPPEGFVNSSNEEINTNTQRNKKLTLLNLLINPFSYFFIR